MIAVRDRAAQERRTITPFGRRDELGFRPASIARVDHATTGERCLSALGASETFAEWRSMMNRLIRGGIAGFAAWKWGGGLFGAILLFAIIYYLLGYL